MKDTSVLTEAVDSQGTCGLVAMTSASHAEGRQFDPGQVYIMSLVQAPRAREALESNSLALLKLCCSCKFSPQALEASVSTVAILAQGTHQAVAPAQAYF